MTWRPHSLVAPLMLLAYAPAAFAQTAPAGAAAQAPVAQNQAPAAMLPPVAAPKGTALTWLGHAAWLLRSPQGTAILIDPWLDNPKQPKGFVLPEHIDAIVVTHGHADHVGEAAALAEKYRAPVVASYELIEALGIKDGIGVNAGGQVTIKDIELHLTQAVHSSSVATAHLPMPPDPEASKGAQGDIACSCPDHSKCPESHHHSAQAVRDRDHDHAHDHGHDHHHGSKHGKHGKGGKHAAEAEELVVGGEASADSRGPKQKAVEEGLKFAAQGDGKVDVEQPAGAQEPCHCGPEHGSVPAADMGHGGMKPHMHYAGAALGVVFKVAMGPTIYHAGDTDVFLDMGLIKRRYEPEVALLPIGGHYTMGPKDAALAASLLGAHDVVPMHYGTSPELTGTADELRQALDDDQRVVAPLPGATITYAERH